MRKWQGCHIFSAAATVRVRENGGIRHDLRTIVSLQGYRLGSPLRIQANTEYVDMVACHDLIVARLYVSFDENLHPGLLVGQQDLHPGPQHMPDRYLPRVVIPGHDPPLLGGRARVVMGPGMAPGAQRDPVTRPLVGATGPGEPVVGVQAAGVPAPGAPAPVTFPYVPIRREI